MSNVKGLTITLEKDIREEDINLITDAVKMIKGVLHVEPTLSTPEDFQAMVRMSLAGRKVAYDFAKDFEKLLHEKLNG